MGLFSEPQGAAGGVMEVVLRKVNLHGDQVSKALKCGFSHRDSGLPCLLSLSGEPRDLQGSSGPEGPPGSAHSDQALSHEALGEFLQLACLPKKSVKDIWQASLKPLPLTDESVLDE